MFFEFDKEEKVNKSKYNTKGSMSIKRYLLIALIASILEDIGFYDSTSHIVVESLIEGSKHMQEIKMCLFLIYIALILKLI